MSGKKVAIVQSNYIPWKGYFDLIRSVDEFILYDEVQFTKNDWRNRNKIKTPQGLKWLSISILHSISQKINEIQVVDNKWRVKHWLTIKQFYRKSPYFCRYEELFERAYLRTSETYLSRINYTFICLINQLLNINTKITWSSDYRMSQGKTERLIDLCRQTGAAEYVSGPRAKDYIDEKLFNSTGIRLTWFDYSGYGSYHQLYPPFEHKVSIIDLIFNEGPNALKYMKALNA